VPALAGTWTADRNRVAFSATYTLLAGSGCCATCAFAICGRCRQWQGHACIGRPTEVDVLVGLLLLALGGAEPRSRGGGGGGGGERALIGARDASRQIWTGWDERVVRRREGHEQDHSLCETTPRACTHRRPYGESYGSPSSALAEGRHTPVCGRTRRERVPRRATRLRFVQVELLVGINRDASSRGGSTLARHRSRFSRSRGRFVEASANVAVGFAGTRCRQSGRTRRAGL
jgi:hypothetical protein